ncbi:MAG TPA: Uma2 family endonuclease [Phycisphaerae bacterium]|jgi:Uma2 family endonuclease
MATEPAVGTVTFAEFLETVREDQKADLIDGVIYYMSSPDNTEHNDLICWLVVVLRIFLRRTDLGRLTVDRVAYWLGERQGPEPDIGIVLSERVGLVKRGYVDGPPDVAIEIVSPESIERDYSASVTNTKMPASANIGSSIPTNSLSHFSCAARRVSSRSR